MTRPSSLCRSAVMHLRLRPWRRPNSVTLSQHCKEVTYAAACECESWLGLACTQDIVMWRPAEAVHMATSWTPPLDKRHQWARHAALMCMQVNTSGTTGSRLARHAALMCMQDAAT
jgi:hypothetical protein